MNCVINILKELHIVRSDSMYQEIKNYFHKNTPVLRNSLQNVLHSTHLIHHQDQSHLNGVKYKFEIKYVIFYLVRYQQWIKKGKEQWQKWIFSFYFFQLQKTHSYTRRNWRKVILISIVLTFYHFTAKAVIKILWKINFN